MTAVQQELMEINHRYTMLGTKLSDRHSELEAVREEVRKALDHLKTLGQFLDRVQRSLPKEQLPNTKDDADKTGKLIKVIKVAVAKHIDVC